MRITCYYGNGCDMGYIFLNRPEEDEFYEYEWSKNEITKFVNHTQIQIPYITDLKVASYLDQMTIVENSYKDDHEKGYDTEYGNDMDNEGYIIGIELTLDLERFIDLIKNQAFKVIQTTWKNRMFHLATFDHADKVFHQKNVIYKMTENEDAFVIIQLEDPKNLGYYYTNDADQRPPIALFKALVSARDDIYPLEYLLKTQFFVRKNESVLMTEDGIWCSGTDKQHWDSISIEKRKNILNNFKCEKCLADVDNLDCTIAMKSKNSLISKLYCNRCEHQYVKVVEWE